MGSKIDAVLEAGEGIQAEVIKAMKCPLFPIFLWGILFINIAIVCVLEIIFCFVCFEQQ